METIFDNWDTIPLTENHLLQLHRDMLQYSKKDERHRGAYKTLRNDVEAFDRNDKTGRCGVRDRDAVRHAAVDAWPRGMTDGCSRMTRHIL